MGMHSYNCADVRDSLNSRHVFGKDTSGIGHASSYSHYGILCPCLFTLSLTSHACTFPNAWLCALPLAECCNKPESAVCIDVLAYSQLPTSAAVHCV